MRKLEGQWPEAGRDNGIGLWRPEAQQRVCLAPLIPTLSDDCKRRTGMCTTTAHPSQWLFFIHIIIFVSGSLTTLTALEV